MNHRIDELVFHPGKAMLGSLHKHEFGTRVAPHTVVDVSSAVQEPGMGLQCSRYEKQRTFHLAGIVQKIVPLRRAVPVDVHRRAEDVRHGKGHAEEGIGLAGLHQLLGLLIVALVLFRSL